MLVVETQGVEIKEVELIVSETNHSSVIDLRFRYHEELSIEVMPSYFDNSFIIVLDIQ